MARNKFKMTGFARFFIVMLILAPAAYIGASYANGEDGIQNFKDLFKGKISMGKNVDQETSKESETTKTVEIPAPSTQSPAIDQSVLEEKDKLIRNLEADNKDLMETNKGLKAELYEKTKALEKLEVELKAMKQEE